MGLHSFPRDGISGQYVGGSNQRHLLLKYNECVTLRISDPDFLCMNLEAEGSNFLGEAVSGASYCYRRPTSLFVNVV